MLPPGQLSLDWVGAQLLAGVVGTVLGVFLRELLPQSISAEIIYWAGRLRKWFKNQNYRLKLSSSYDFTDQPRHEDLVEELAQNLGERPQDVGNFQYTIPIDSSTISVNLVPQFSGEVSRTGEVDIDQNTVESITASFECSPRYRDLVPTLIELQSAERSVVEAIASVGGQQTESIVQCEMSAKPVLQKLLGAGNIETLQAKSPEGTRIDISREEIQIHSPPSQSILPTIRRAIVYYT